MKTIDVHISEIKVGDTILHDGVSKTVCKSNIKWDSLWAYHSLAIAITWAISPSRRLLSFN